jgi:hypothetical protein
VLTIHLSRGGAQLLAASELGVGRSQNEVGRSQRNCWSQTLLLCEMRGVAGTGQGCLLYCLR